MTPYYSKYKTSTGVACCRFNNNTVETLVVRKRCTYAFVTFLHGKYKSDDNHTISHLLNKMTSDEKFDIMSLNFDQMWYRAWQHASRRSLYYTAKAKFEGAFLNDTVRLRNLVGISHNQQPLWEIPKGVKSTDDESDILCAVRELEEETGVQKNQYKLINGARYIKTYTDEDVYYTNIYYLAASVGAKPQLKIDYHNSEIAEIKWVTLAEAKSLNADLHNMLKSIVSYCKQHRDEFDIEI